MNDQLVIRMVIPYIHQSIKRLLIRCEIDKSLLQSIDIFIDSGHISGDGRHLETDILLSFLRFTSLRWQLFLISHLDKDWRGILLSVFIASPFQTDSSDQRPEWFGVLEMENLWDDRLSGNREMVKLSRVLRRLRPAEDHCYTTDNWLSMMKGIKNEKENNTSQRTRSLTLSISGKHCLMTYSVVYEDPSNFVIRNTHWNSRHWQGKEGRSWGLMEEEEHVRMESGQ